MPVAVPRILIGVHITAASQNLAETIAALHETTIQPFDLVVLYDPTLNEAGNVGGTYGQVRNVRRLTTPFPGGAAASFNRLISQNADVYVFLECGVRPAKDWLTLLLAAFDAHPTAGLAGPSTNHCWNEQAVAQNSGGSEHDIERQANALLKRYGNSSLPMNRLHNLGEFCLVIRNEVVQAIGAADEAYGRGPCWEMDYSVRAARAGFEGLWVQAAFAYRSPLPAWRAGAERELLENSKRLYQDRFCGRRARHGGAEAPYHTHCHGEACADFAPAAATRIYIPLPQTIPAASEGLPLISCIMPTRGRARFVAQAILYFRRQDYAHKELIIAYEDDNDLPPRIEDSNIVAVQTAQRSIGGKRNAAVDAARGEIIVHWDDDDWHSDQRLSRQVLPILQNVADMTGLNDNLFLVPARREFWSATRELFSHLFAENVTGGTLMYRREFWQRAGPYPSISLREDVDFMLKAMRAGARLCRLPGRDTYVIVRHGHNTWQFGAGYYLRASEWSRVDEPECLAADRSFYFGDDSIKAAAALLEGSTMVSCIMPTANRRPFITGAITRFLAQDYPAKELVILDDGEDGIADLIPENPAIRYLRTSRHRSLGAKRNAACEAARGDVILHWDDDDWYAPHRIRIQTEAMLASGADVCGIDRVLFIDPRARAAWEYVYPSGLAPWVCGAALCYSRKFWAEHPFIDANVGEDTRFTARARRERLHILRDNRFFVALIHASNTSPKNVHDSRWQPADFSAVGRLVGPDWPPTPSPTGASGSER